jgi:hypothetical protein
VIPPTPVRYQATAGDTIELCTKFVPDGGHALLHLRLAHRHVEH